MYPFKLDRLALAISLIATGAPLALAAPGPMEETVISARPIRASEAAAIDAKRNADNFVDIVAADTIGRFPDQNLADSLGRLPGLAVERDQGQARYINFRGAPFRYTSIAFDGIDVVGAENGRIPRFDAFPSVITSRIEANKAVLPSMPGESIAGYINIHTFSPFDQEGWSVAADIGLWGEQALGGGDIDKYSLRTSWSGERFGFALFGSENSREQVTDNRELDLERDAAGELIANELDFRSYKIQREDRAWGGNFEYRDDESMLRRAFVSTLYSEFVDEEARNQFIFGFTDPQPGVVRTTTPVSVTRVLQQGQYENSTFTNTLGADMQLGAWQVKGRLNHTQTESLMDLPMPRSLGVGAIASFDLQDREDPRLWLDRDLASLSYPMILGIYYGQELEIDSDKIKLDAERAFSWGGFESQLAIGLQYDERAADGFVATNAMGSFPSSIDLDAYNTGRRWDTGMTNTIGGTYYDNQAVLDTWQASGQLLKPAANDTNTVAIDEKISAAYVAVTTEFGWGSLVAGARMEHTDYSSEGAVFGERVSHSDESTHVLPSAHLTVNLAEDLKLRVSGTSGISRPTYSEWRATASIDAIDGEVSGGNPALEPEEAIGADVALEWYYAPAGLLSVGAFYRSIDNVIYADSSVVDGGLYLPSAAGERWTYTGSINGKKGELRGVEFNAIAQFGDFVSWLDGFGASANLTLLDSEFEAQDGRKYDLPGTSDTVYNASLFFERYGASIRLNYQYRDQWISPLEDPSEYWGEQKRLDLSASYLLPVDLNGLALSVYLNANNLTDETDVRYAGNGTINQVEGYGRSYLVGLRLNY